MNTKIGESTIFKAETVMLTSGETQTYQNYKISYGRLDTLDVELLKFTNKRVKETESTLQESVIMSLEK